MNIEIANRLVNLRKEKGYSQEELAAKLGISRQAVSKWERAEASPDTDNLICLAKLYGVSLDEILKSDESVEDIVSEQPSPEAEETKEEKPDEGTPEPDSEESGSKRKKKDYVHIGVDGIHVVDGDGSEVHIDHGGIFVNDGDGEVFTSGKYSDSNSNWAHHWHKHKKADTVNGILSGVWTFAVVVAYILLGFLVERGWEVGWVLFLTIGFVPTIIPAISRKSFCAFAFPVLVTAIFLFIGMMWGIWHPTWVVFLLIPVYYIVFGPVDKAIRDHELKKMGVTVNHDFVDNDDDDDDDDKKPHSFSFSAKDDEGNTVDMDLHVDDNGVKVDKKVRK